MPDVMRSLVELQDVRRDFDGRAGVVRAVDGVSLTIRRGRTLGLVGESGSGKSTLGRLALRLESMSGGRVVYDGTDLTEMNGRQLRRLRARFQMIFQDPVSSLNPRMRVGETIVEPLAELAVADKRQRAARRDELIDMVGLTPSTVHRYPRELSGGQAQRVGIARALRSRHSSWSPTSPCRRWMRLSAHRS